MKRVNAILAGAITAITVASLALAQGRSQDQTSQPDGDRVIVPFSDPSRPGLVKVSLLNGSITVMGYDGKGVLVEARSRDGDERDEDSGDEEALDRKHKDKRSGNEGRRPTAGMHRIRNTATGLTVEEDDNVMVIGAEALNRNIDLSVKVPAKCSLELSTVNNGDLQVEGVEGEIDVNNTNGGIELRWVFASAIAVVLSLIIFALTLVQFRFFERGGEDTHS